MNRFFNHRKDFYFPKRRKLFFDNFINKTDFLSKKVSISFPFIINWKHLIKKKFPLKFKRFYFHFRSYQLRSCEWLAEQPVLGWKDNQRGLIVKTAAEIQPLVQLNLQRNRIGKSSNISLPQTARHIHQI